MGVLKRLLRNLYNFCKVEHLFKECHNFRWGRLDFLLHHNRCQQVKMSLPNHIEKGLTRLMKLFIECATENGRIRIYAWNLCIQFLISQSIQSLTFGV